MRENKSCGSYYIHHLLHLSYLRHQCRYLLLTLSLLSERSETVGLAICAVMHHLLCLGYHRPGRVWVGNGRLCDCCVSVWVVEKRVITRKGNTLPDIVTGTVYQML